MAVLGYPMVVAAALLLTGSFFLGYVPLLLPLIVLVLSLLLFVTYWRDKRASERGDQRTPENFLHLLALLGGWPGGFVAQQVFRHKTRKVSFQWVFWLTVCVNVAAVVWLHMPVGADLLSGQMAVLRELVNSDFGSKRFSELLMQVLSYRQAH